MRKIIAFILGWCLVLTTLVFSIKAWALNPDFYIQKYQEMRLAETLHVSNHDLNKSITVLLDYLDNRKETIQVTIHKNGNKTSAFDTRETRHMVDVKVLYQNTLKVGYGSLALGIFLLIYVLRQKNAWAYITKGILRASLCFLIFIAFLALWVATDFTDFWTHFHQVFFTNDYWLLTPGIDFMIDMLPEEVFYTLVIRIVLTIVIVLGSINGACIYYQKKKAPIGFEEEI